MFNVYAPLAIQPHKIRSLVLDMPMEEVDKRLGNSTPQSTEMFEVGGKIYELRRYLTFWKRHTACNKPIAECGTAYEAGPHLKLFYLVFDVETRRLTALGNNEKMEPIGPVSNAIGPRIELEDKYRNFRRDLMGTDIDAAIGQLTREGKKCEAKNPKGRFYHHITTLGIASCMAMERAWMCPSELHTTMQYNRDTNKIEHVYMAERSGCW